jgi:hypothetical protein
VRLSILTGIEVEERLGVLRLVKLSRWVGQMVASNGHTVLNQKLGLERHCLGYDTLRAH